MGEEVLTMLLDVWKAWCWSESSLFSASQRGLNSTVQSCSSVRPVGNFAESKVNIFSDTVVGGHGSGGLAAEYSLALHSPAAHSTVAVDKLVAGVAVRNKENVLPASKWTEASVRSLSFFLLDSQEDEKGFY